MQGPGGWTRVHGLLLCLFLAVFFSGIVPVQANNYGCVDCLTATRLLLDFAESRSLTISKGIEAFCALLPEWANVACLDVADRFAPEIIYVLDKTDSPDVACELLNFCSPKCKLWTNGTDVEPGQAGYLRSHIEKIRAENKTPPSWWSAVVQFVLNEIYIVYNNHMPLLDADDDAFSVFSTLRGNNWRGRDCSSANADIYPGRLPDGMGDADRDTNCNGIYGINPHTGHSWEKELCGDTEHYGIAVVGDSAAAHFMVPPAWTNASSWTANTFRNITSVLENEMDHPQTSAITGYQYSTNGAPRSIFWKMYQRNPCIHRDYQNIAYNGNDAHSIIKLIKTLKRDPVKDHPMMVFMFDIGDDICSDTLAEMTPVKTFYHVYLEALKILDSKLPPNSHVVAFGLTNFTDEFAAMANQKHPMGFTYKELYAMLTCCKSNPCGTLLNPNATERDLAVLRGKELSHQYEIIRDTVKFKNFKLHFIDDPVHHTAQQYINAGGNIVDLVQPFDGFHPSQLLSDLIADYVWKQLFDLGVVPPANPHALKIKELFGDQGGF